MTAGDEPLRACGDRLNCVRVRVPYPLDAATLYARVRSALGALGPVRLRAKPRTNRLEAVYRVFVFRDDVAAVVEARGDGAVLHLRSASRVGRADLGVNRRRVHRILRRVDAG